MQRLIFLCVGINQFFEVFISFLHFGDLPFKPHILGGEPLYNLIFLFDDLLSFLLLLIQRLMKLIIFINKILILNFKPLDMKLQFFSFILANVESNSNPLAE
jgi:hypothetical protein